MDKPVQVGIYLRCKRRLGGRQRVWNEGLNRFAQRSRDGVSARSSFHDKAVFNVTFLYQSIL